MMDQMWNAALIKYGWVWLGLTCGFAAKYALLIKRGVRVQAKLVVADLLLLPMVALIAYWLATLAGVDAEVRALWAAFCTVGADRLVKLLTDRFLQRVDSDVRGLAEETIGRVRQEVQVERSASDLIAAAREGRAPERYVALDPHPQAPTK